MGLKKTLTLKIITCLLLINPLFAEAEKPKGEWINRYETQDAHILSGIAVDGSGNSYVTGITGSGPYNIITLKYDTSGNEMWAKKYEHEGWNDRPQINLDPEGNVFIATSKDFTFTILKYSSEGDLVWQKTFDTDSYTFGPWAALDSSGNICLTGRVGMNTLVVVKFDGIDGEQLWSSYREIGLGGLVNNIAIDSNDNVYVTGAVKYGPDWGGWTELIIVKYDSNGDEIWAEQQKANVKFKSKGWRKFAGKAIDFDSSGNPYLLAEYSSSNSTGNILIKYDSTGHELWHNRYDKVDLQFGLDIKIDSLDNAYVASSGLMPRNMHVNWGVRKYDSRGNFLWASSYDAGPKTANSSQNPKVTLDKYGEIYLAGSRNFGRDQVNAQMDYVTLKYDATGKQLWRIKYDDGKKDHLVNIVVDNNDNLYVAGGSYSNSSGKQGYATIKCSQEPPLGSRIAKKAKDKKGKLSAKLNQPGIAMAYNMTQSN